MAELLENMPILPMGYEFHHIGYATSSVENEKRLFLLLGYNQEGKTFVDPTQGVAGCFLVSRGPRLEILENLPGSSTLASWLDAGIKLYHFAFVVEDLEAAIAWARRVRAKVTMWPVSSVAFNGRRITFVMLRNGLMLEFIEKHRHDELLNCFIETPEGCSSPEETHSGE